MKKFLILGSTIAGIKCAEELRNIDPSCEIKILSLDGKYPSVPEKYPDLITGDVSTDDILYKNLEFFENNKIEVVLNKKIIKINTKKNLLTTEEKEQINYDVLILSDLPEHRVPDIKGKTKIGSYGFKRLSDVEKIIEQMPFFNEVCIESDTFIGLMMAVSLLKKKKEVCLIISDTGFFRWALDEEDSLWITEMLKEKGLNIFPEARISELLGDADIKAVKLTTGKVLSAHAVLFDRTKEDFRILQDSLLNIDNGIIVDDNFKTNLDNVYALSNICRQENGFIPNDPSNPYYKTGRQEAQGICVARSIMNKEALSGQCVLIDRFVFEDISINIVGKAFLDEDVSTRKVFDKDSKSLKVFFSRDEKLIGAFLVNSETDINKIKFLIEQQADFSVAEELIGSSSQMI